MVKDTFTHRDVVRDTRIPQLGLHKFVESCLITRWDTAK
jgi:hypothetical protein